MEMPDFLAYQKALLVIFCSNGIEMGENYLFIDYFGYLHTILCYKAFNNTIWKAPFYPVPRFYPCWPMLIYFSN